MLSKQYHRECIKMAPCYSKNCILKGTVDFYCLVCETYLRSEADNIDHIAKPIHKKNLENTQYVKDFEEDFVRKIKKGYFCELCNKLLPMMARVKIHVNEPSHIDSKNIMFFKRIGPNVLAFGKVVLNDKAWNGLNDESCAFCNTEYEDEAIHKNLLSHILNIIQVKVEVDDNKNIYRKIDDVSFHCLTCNMVLALNNIIRHFEEDQHKHLYQECCAISLNKTNKSELIEKELNKMTEDQSPKTNDRLAVQLNNTEKNPEQAHAKRGSFVNRKCDVLEETTAIDAMPLNKIDENEKESKIAINSIVTEEVEGSKENNEDCVASPSSNITIENKEESKPVKDIDANRKCDILEKTTAIDAMPLNKIDENEKESKIAINSVVNEKVEDSKENSDDCVARPSNKTVENKEKSNLVKDIDVNKTNKNLAEKKVKKNKRKINQLNNTKKIRSGFNIEKYEKKICKVLNTEDYITLDENGKTLCILCDWIMDPKTKKIHITGLHHQTMEKMHKKRLAEMGDKNDKEMTVLENDNILDLVSKFQGNNVNINLISNTAVCKKCTADLPYDVNAIEEHILKHNNENFNEDKVMSQSCEAMDKETSENTSEVTKESNEVITENGNEGNEENLVSVEDVKENEPTSEQALVNIDEELVSNETSLKDEAKSGTSELLLIKQSLGIFIKTFTGVKHLIFHDILINDIFCISVTSFHYLFSTKGDIKCLICEEEEVGDMEAHINTLKHIHLLNEIPVIINEKSEFIREINPELLHCGFCNITVLSWSAMQEHLNTPFHKDVKNAAAWRMKVCSTELVAAENENRASPEFEEIMIKNMLSRLFN